MKRYKEIRLLFVAVCVFAILLCGCGNNNVNNDSENESPDEEVFDFDYSGNYQNENGDTVKITANDDGTYSIEITLLGLAVFECDSATVENQALWFTTTDPAGGYVLGCFHFWEGDSFIVEFANIEWEYIHSGDCYEGFVK